MDFGRHEDLSGRDFSGQDLRNYCFDYTIIKGSKFRGALVEGASFRYAQADNADFTGAEGRADFTGMRGIGVRIVRAYLGSSIFEKAVLPKLRADYAILDGTRCYEAEFPDSSFYRVYAIHADFERVKAPRAYFDWAVLREVYASGADFEDGSFIGTNIRAGRLDCANFTRVRAPGLDLTGAYCDSTVFDGAFLRGAYLGRTHLARASFNDANLEKTILDPRKRGSGPKDQFQADPERPGWVLAYRPLADPYGPRYDIVGKEYKAPLSVGANENHPGIRVFSVSSGKHPELLVTVPARDLHQAGKIWRCRRMITLAIC